MNKLGVLFILFCSIAATQIIAEDDVFGSTASGREQYYIGTSFADDYEIQQLSSMIKEAQERAAMPFVNPYEAEPYKKRVQKLIAQRNELIRKKQDAQTKLNQAKKDSWKVEPFNDPWAQPPSLSPQP